MTTGRLEAEAGFQRVRGHPHSPGLKAVLVVHQTSELKATDQAAQ